jgi:hypothetical protein
MGTPDRFRAGSRMACTGCHVSLIHTRSSGQISWAGIPLKDFIIYELHTAYSP